MSEIKVPDEMLKAAMNTRMVVFGGQFPWSDGYCQMILEAALRWLDIEIRFLLTDDKSEEYAKAIEDVRRMFLAEPEIPEEVKDLTWAKTPPISNYYPDTHNEQIIEAYRRGRASKDGKR